MDLLSVNRNCLRPKSAHAKSTNTKSSRAGGCFRSFSLASGVSFLALSASLAFAPNLSSAFAAGATPSGGQFAAGAGAIVPTANGLSIAQSTSRGIIDWQSFSIGQGNAVNIANGSGATLNRVTGGNISNIAGSLTSTGSVYVINPAGIVVMPTGQVVTTGSFVASTRDVSNSSFMAGGAQNFKGTSNGTVVNQGSITSANGDVILVGQSVTNSGQISAPKGTVGLAAGDDILLQPSSDPEITINAGTGDATNSGNIAAAQAELAAAGGNVYALATNNGGVIRATGSATKDGHVYLTAGGNVTVTGTVSATNADGSGGTVKAIAGGTTGTLSVAGAVNVSAISATAKGGTATLTGNTVNIGSTAIISANGGTDGGNIFIGGDRHGGTDPSVALSVTPIPNAQYTTVSAGANIAANGGWVAGTLLGAAGNGGNVVVWSNISTDYAGAISAQGGASGGNGGFVEVSGEQLAFTGTVNTLAPLGAAGTLLLDPSDVTIVSNTDTNGTTATTHESASSPYNPTGTGTTASPGNNSSYILNTDIDAALQNGNVVINTGSLGDGNTGSGSIHFGTPAGQTPGTNAAPLYWTSNSSLTLNALGTIDENGGAPTSATGTSSLPAAINASATGQLIVTTGTGNITFNAGGNGVTGATATVITLIAPIVANGGTITLAATTANYQVSTSSSITNTYQTAAAPGNVVLQADNVRLGSANPYTGTVTTTGDVIVRPFSSTMTVGNNNSTSAGNPYASQNTVTIDNASIQNISANTLVLGSPNITSLTLESSTIFSGNAGIQVGNGANNVGNGTNLELLSGGSISQDSITPIFVAGNSTNTNNYNNGGLSVMAGGAVSLPNFLNEFGSLAIQAGGNTVVQGNTTSDNTGTFNIGTVGLAGTGYVVSGITAPSSSVTLINVGSTTQGTTAGAQISASNLILEGAATGPYATYGNYSNPGTTTTYPGPFNGSYTLNNINNAISNIAGSVSTLSLTNNPVNLTNGSLTVAANLSDNLDTLTQNSGNQINATSFSGITATGTGLTAGQAAVTIVDNGKLIIAANPTVGSPMITAAAGTIILEDGSPSYGTGTVAANTGFINQDGATAFSVTGAGNYWRIYSQDPRNDVDGGLDNTTPTTGASFVQYGAANYYGAPTANGNGTGSGALASPFTNANSVLSASSTAAVNNGNAAITGNGFLYTVVPAVTETGTANLTKVYDGNSNYNGGVGNTTLTYSSVTGAINGDTVSLTQPTVPNSNLYQGNVNVGTYSALTISGVTVSTTASLTHDANNVTAYGYTVSPTPTYTAAITPKPVTVSGSRAYNGLTDASSSVLGSIASQEISGDPVLTITGTGSVASPNASAIAQALTTSNGLVTGLSLSGTGSGNYAIVSGALTINQAQLTLTPVAVTTQYNATTLNNTTYSDTLANYTISGFQNNETAGGINLALSGSMAFTVGGTATAVKDVATYNQGVGTLALTSTNSNYSLNFTNPTPNNYVITPAPLTITAVTQTKVYDGTTASTGTPTITAGSLQGSDTLTGLSQSYGSPNVLGTNLSTLSVNGGYTLANSNDYTVTLVTAPGTITQAALTLTPVAVTTQYNATTLNNTTYSDTLSNYAISGFQNGESAAGDGLVLSGAMAFTVGGTPTAVRNAATYNQGAGTLALTTTNGNYSLNFTNPVPHNYVITQAPVTVSGSKTYDGSATASYSTFTSPVPVSVATGVLAADSGNVTITASGSATLGAANAGSYSTANGASSVSNGMTLNGLGITLNGSAAGNYYLAGATYTIAPVVLTVTNASGGKVYDGTTAVPAVDLTLLSNLQNGDTLGGTGAHALTISGTGLITSANVGTYTGGASTFSVAGLTLNGADAGNYTLGAGSFTVTSAPLTITAVTQTKTYDGTTTSTGTPTITAGSLKGSDTLTGLSQFYTSPNVLGTNNSTLSVGSGYTLANSGNYNVTLASAPGTITPEAIVITAVPTTKTYDGTPSSPGTPVVTSGIIYPADPGTLTQTYGGPNAGTGLTLTPTGTFTNSTNYTVTYVPVMTGVINPAPLTLSGTRVYDGQTDASGSILTASGEIPGDPTLTVSGTGTVGTDNVGTTPLASLGSLTLVGSGSGNYTISNGTVTITPAQLVLAAVNTTKVYDGGVSSNGTPVVTGLIGSDTISALTQTYNSRNVLGTNGSTLTVSPGYTITDGNGGGNYTVVAITSPGTITPEPITVIGTPVSKPYDRTPGSPGVPIIINGRLYGPDIGIFTETYGGPNAGTNLTLTPTGTITDGNGGGNYVVTYVPVTTGTITPLPVILFGTRVYDSTTNAAASILTFTNDLDGSNLTLSGTGTLIAPTVGLEPISSFTGLALGGSAAGNYTLAGAIGNVQVTPVAPTQVLVPLNQTASGVSEVPSDFTIYDGGILYVKSSQNGIVTGTIATIDGQAYQPDNQLGCTLSATGACVESGIAPTAGRAPAGAR